MTLPWVNAVAEMVREIQWFRKCGDLSSHLDDIDADIVRVTTWPDALARCMAPEWEDTTLNAQNTLTEHLHLRCSNLYANWNEVIAQIKVSIIAPIVDPAILPIATRFELPQVFLDCVHWDILHAVAEIAYEGCRPPAFFRRLLAVYRRGHFPCGWNGEWPDGQLLVF